MSPEHTEIIQVIRDTANMLLTDLGGRIDRVEDRLDRVEYRLDQHDARFDQIDRKFDEVGRRFAEIIDTMHANQDTVLQRLERLEDEGSALNALLRRHGILTAAG